MCSQLLLQIRHWNSSKFLFSKTQTKTTKTPRVSLWGGQGKSSSNSSTAPCSLGCRMYWVKQRTTFPSHPIFRSDLDGPCTVCTSSCISGVKSPNIFPLSQSNQHHPVLTKPWTGPELITPPSFPTEALANSTPVFSPHLPFRFISIWLQEWRS